MRVHALFLALILTLVSSACARSVGEPLRGDNSFRRPSRDLPVNGRLIGEGAREEPVVDEPVDPLVAELVATVSFASEQAYLTADAGLAHDRGAALDLAVSLADAAALVSQRALEFQSAGDGCEGADAPAEVDDAVLFSALAAEAAANVASELVPPSSTVCEGGCHGGCTEVPGTVDEIALGAAIDAATDAGVGCATAGSALEAL